MSKASSRLILAVDHYAVLFTKKGFPEDVCCAIYQEMFPRRCDSGQELVGSTAWVTGMNPLNMSWYWLESGERETQFTR